MSKSDKMTSLNKITWAAIWQDIRRGHWVDLMGWASLLTLCGIVIAYVCYWAFVLHPINPIR